MLTTRIHHFATLSHILASIVDLCGWNYLAVQDIRLVSPQEFEGTFWTSQLCRRTPHRSSRIECRKGFDSKDVGSNEGTRCR